ncbi:hypothetical protein F5Y04DRAFT_279122 [Hypomontagnella monticulosa]|nr:hypothetical protein F5Y04DRAFT_279122 [Hypomontagnella monticulosa]
MPSTTTSKKPQPTPPTLTTPMPDKGNPDSKVGDKQKDPKEMKPKGLIELFREAEEREAKMSPEEKAKERAWLEPYKGIRTTPDQVPDLWDEI